MRKIDLKFLLCGVLLLGVCLCVSGCRGDDKSSFEPIATITFDRPDGIYVVKVGASLTIEPRVDNDQDAFYSWTTSRGEIIGRDKSLVFSAAQSGQHFVTFRVFTDYGVADKEIRIDVASLVPPTILLTVPKDGFVILQGHQLLLDPSVDNSEQATFEWLVDRERVATTKQYSFSSDKVGRYHLSLASVNEDGTDFIEFDVDVKSPQDMPFSWIFQSDVYNVSVGRSIRLLPYGITNAFDAQYTWTIDGKQVQQGSAPLYVFDAQAQGVHVAELTVTNKYTTQTKRLTINVCSAEGSYRRAVLPVSEVSSNQVFEFLAAAGQFVNEDYTATSMQAACAYAAGQLAKGAYVSLGGFGGYIVVGFDHSVDNDGGYNFQIIGNSFTGSSEPGIVYVMQDENGDLLPNDTWYELQGSEYGKPETIPDYEITYYRPGAASMPVKWSDNQGRTGYVDYLAAYHRQAYYYPLWADATSYTLRGTCLKSRTREVNPGFWSNDEFEWGYSDNFSSIDRLTSHNNPSAAANANHFKISNAVTFDGRPANLQYIDFVKIQTGVNAKAGWLGEVSVEVFGVRDYNMIKNK